jgi:DNA-binding protein YbaB
MFEKLKQIGKLKEIQKSLEEEKVEIKNNGTRLVINGNLKVIEVSLNPELEKEEQEKVLAECFNEGMDKVKSFMAQKFQSIL